MTEGKVWECGLNVNVGSTERGECVKKCGLHGISDFFAVPLQENVHFL